MQEKLAKFALFTIMVSLIALAIYYYNNTLPEKGRYEIIINDGSHTTYTTNKYEIDPITSCVVFQDVKKVKRTVCGNYTISEK